MNLKTVITSASLAAVGMSSALADLLIDPYTQPVFMAENRVVLRPSLPIPPGTPGLPLAGPYAPPQIYADASIYGGARILDINLLDVMALTSQSSESNLRASDGSLSFGNDPGMVSQASVTYDGNGSGLNPAPAAGVDLNAYGIAFMIDVLSSDGVPLNVTVEVRQEGAAAGSSVTVAAPMSGPSAMSFPFSLFNPADIAAADWIQLQLGFPLPPIEPTPPPAFLANWYDKDIAMDNFRIVVPEASQFYGVGALAVLLGVWRYRRSVRTS
jgi:hypothetical protein